MKIQFSIFGERVTSWLIGCILMLFASTITPIRAQSQNADSLFTGQCDEISSREFATEFLETSNIKATIRNNGFLFWPRGERGGPYYSIPKTSEKNSEFVVSLVIGGMVDDELRVAGSSYGPQEYWPGPLNETGFASSSCFEFDRLWKMDRADIDLADRSSPRFTQQLTNWPVELGAPFIDADGDQHYDPQMGDRPRLLGDHMVWWVMNDRAGKHVRYDSTPLGIEVRGTAYGYDHPGILGNTTFFRYEITNRNDSTIDSLFVAWYRDLDLGDAFDDFIGSDTTSHMAYAYNGDNDDEGPSGYGVAPPASGFTILTSDQCLADYASQVLTGFKRCWEDELHVNLPFIDCCGPPSEPDSAAGWHSWLNGVWTDGSQLSAAGSWRNMRFAPDNGAMTFPGDPEAGIGWSEVNVDGAGTSNRPWDRKHAAGSRSKPLQPNETVVVTFALIWSRGTNNLNSVTRLKQETGVIRSLQDEWVSPSIEVSALEEQIPFNYSVSPNPTSDDFNLTISTPQRSSIHVEMFDTLGRRVAEVFHDPIGVGVYSMNIDSSSWPPGIYLVRMRLNHVVKVHSLVKY